MSTFFRTIFEGFSWFPRKSPVLGPTIVYYTMIYAMKSIPLFPPWKCVRDTRNYELQITNYKLQIIHYRGGEELSPFPHPGGSAPHPGSPYIKGELSAKLTEGIKAVPLHENEAFRRSI